MKTPSFVPPGVNVRPGDEPRRVRQLLHWCACWCLVLIGGGLSTARGQTAAPAVASPLPRLSAAAEATFRKELAAVEAEKDARTPAQLKMDSHLVNAAHEEKEGVAVKGAPMMRSGIERGVGGIVLVEIKATVTKGLLDAVTAHGGVIVNAFPADGVIRARVPISELETLAARSDVRFIGAAPKATVKAFTPPALAAGTANKMLPAVTTRFEGVKAHRADIVQSAVNVINSTVKVTGQGVKVGVLSDSDDFLQTSINQGYLPSNVTTLSGQSGSPGTGEGTAMMEVVHSMAPGAQLYFATGFGGETNMAANIRALFNAGCRIIIDDVGYGDESPFQDGAIEGAINDVCGSGALYFSAAGNDGNLTSGTSSVWEGDFVPLDAANSLAWSSNSSYNKISGANTQAEPDVATLFWSDPKGKSSNDYDLYTYTDAGHLIESSTNAQTGTQDPYEHIDTLHNGDNLWVQYKHGARRFLHVSVASAHLAISTDGSTRGHCTATPTNSFCVAATDATLAPNGVFAAGTADPVESFSCDGPRRRFYDFNGKAYTPGNFSSTGGNVYNKPDLTAADGVHTSGIFGNGSSLNDFYGTSCAAPHAGAIAALVWCYNPSLTAKQVHDAMIEGTVDIETQGIDRDTGVGIVMADRAVASVGPFIQLTPPGVIFNEPYEQVSGTQGFPFTIQNTGLSPLPYQITGDGGFLVVQDADATGTIAAGSSKTVNIYLDNNAVNGAAIGTYTGHVYANDTSGVAPALGIIVTLNVSDTNGPGVVIQSPANNANLSAFGTISGTASDPSGIVGSLVNLTLYHNDSKAYWDGTEFTSTQASVSAHVNDDGTWTYTGALPVGTTLRAGSYTLTATAVDNDNNVTAVQSGVNQVYFSVAAASPPLMTVSTPVNGSAIQAFSTVSGTAVDNSSSGIAGNVVDFNLYSVQAGAYWSGTGWSNTAVTLVAPYNPSTQVWLYNGKLPSASNNTLMQGQYLLSAYTYDNTNKVSTAESGVNNIQFIVDSVPPTLTLAGPADQTTIAALPGLTGTLIDSNSGGASVVLYLHRDSDNTYWNGSSWVAASSNPPALATTYDGTNTWTYNGGIPYPGGNTAYNLTNGTYEISVLGTDKAGNQTQIINTFTEDFAYTWTGATIHDSDPNNDSSSWETAANWSPNGVPGAGDKAIINNGDAVDLSASRTLRALVLGGNSSINAYAVTVTGTGSAFNGGQMNGTTFVVSSGATLAVDTSGSPQLYGATLINSGTVTLNASNASSLGAFQGNTAKVNNQSTGVIQLGRDGQLFQSVGSQSVINNSGTITKTAGTGVSDLGNIDLANAATGVIGAASGTLEITSGTVTFASGSKLSGAGTMLWLTPITVTGQLNVLTNLRFQNSVTYNAATLAQGTGGQMHWDTNYWTGTVTLPAGVTLPIDTTGSPQLYGTTFNNFGTLVLSASDANNPGTFQANSATLNNQSSGVVQLTRDGQIIQSVGSESLIVNQAGGKFVKTTAASGRTLVSAYIENNGTVEVDAGTLAFDAGSNGVATTGVFTAATASARVEFAGSEFIMKAGANFTGPGRPLVTAGSVTMNGAVTVGSSSAAAGGFELNGGAIDGPGSLSLVAGDGPFVFTTGNMSTTLNIATGVSMTVDTTGSPQLYGGTLNNSGTVTLSASVAGNPGTFQANNATINNQSGGVIQLGRDGQLFQSVGSQSFIKNSGTITKTAGTGVTDLGNIDLANAASGVLSVASGTLEITSGTVTFASGSKLSGAGKMLWLTPITVTGQLNVLTSLRFQSGVTFNTVTLAQGTGGAMHWDTGNWSGTVTIPAGVTLPIDMTGSPQLYGTSLTNNGTLTLSASDANNPGTLNANNATIINLTGGAIQLARDGQMFQSVGSQSFIKNSGNLIKSAGTGVTDLGNIDLANAGTGVVGAASGTLEITSGTVSFASGSKLSGLGKVLVLADVTFNGATTATTEVHLQGGTKTFNSGASLVQGTGGQLRLDSGNVVGTWAIPAGTTVVADTTGSPQLYGSTLNNSGTLTLTASSAQNPGTFNADNAIINNLSGGVIQLAHDGQLFQSVATVSTLSNTGTITKTGGTGTSDLGNITLLCHGTLNVPTAGSILLLSGGTTFDGTGSTISGAGIVSSADLTLNGPINIAAGGTLEFGADAGTLTGAVDSNNKPLGAINGPGTFLLTGGTITGTLDLGATLPTTLNTANSLLFNGSTLNNAGTITVTGGQNALQGNAATFNNLAGANLVLQSNAFLQSVNQTSNFVNAGTATLGPKPVIVTTDWNFTQTGTGLLKLAIKGTSATAPGFSQLKVVTNPVTLSGTIEGDLASGFAPASKTVFEVLTFPSHTGDFSKVTYPNAPSGTALTKTTEAADVKLVVALAPSITSALAASANDGESFTYQIAASNTPTSFNATNLPAGLSVDTKTGKITGTLQAAGTYNITISATNAAGTDTKTLKLTVKEVVPTITNPTAFTITQGTAFSYQVVATNNPTSYVATGLPPGLSIDTTKGIISGTPTKAGTYSATIGASNSAGTGTVLMKFTINPPAPVVTSAKTATGNAGVAFTYQIVATNTPTGYNATGLPSDLTVNKTSGVISGAPKNAGTYTITLTATNAGGSGTATLTLTVKAVPVITSATSATAQQGKAFTYQITATNTPTSYGATGLPSGLSVSASTGAITGSPKNAGSYTVTLKAINASGTGTATLALNVTASAPVITSPKTATATQNSAFSYQIVATNTPTSYGATGLPSGLTVNTKTGVISGTTTATGTKSITLKATNAAGTGTATLALTINKSSSLDGKNGDVAKTGTATDAKSAADALAIAASARIISAAVVDAQLGKPLSYEIVANRDANTFAASDLPGGLELDAATGVISGTPTELGAFKIGLTARSGREVAKGELTLNISNEPVPVPVIASELAASSEAGQPFSYEIAASGDPVSYGVDGLPEGVSIDPYSGLIAGTPTAAGTYQVVLSATNQGGTGTGTLTLTITPAPLPVVTASATVARVTTGSGTAGVITLTLPKALPDDLTVAYEVKGSAINGTDYRLLRGNQTIRAGRTKATVRIVPQVGGSDDAPRKVVRFVLVPGENYEVATPAPVEVEILAGN